jgi:hypothetical protein
MRFETKASCTGVSNVFRVALDKLGQPAGESCLFPRPLVGFAYLVRLLPANTLQSPPFFQGHGRKAFCRGVTIFGTESYAKHAAPY